MRRRIAGDKGPISRRSGEVDPSKFVDKYMTRELATRIAGNMVREFSREKHFAFSLPSRTALDMIASSLSEDYGCCVVINEEANKIAVRVPSQELAPELVEA
jgi:hypothetical protein